MSEHMTEEQIKNRLREIRKTEEALREERHAYEKTLEEERKRKIIENRQAFVGKCYSLNQSVPCRHAYIKAFKILEILNSPNENYALCLTLVRGLRNTCFQEFGVLLETLPLWNYDTMVRVPSKDELRMIDCYTGISEDIFNEKVKSHTVVMSQYYSGDKTEVL